MARIITSEDLTPHHRLLVIESPEVASEAAAGHLVMMRRGGASLFMPHAVADFDRDAGTITVVTRRTETDDTEVDVTGPIGRPSIIRGSAKVLCVAEDVGVAALYPRLRLYKKNDAYTVVVAGFASREHIYWRERIESLADELFIVTEDGSFGVKGPIRQAVRAIVQHTGDIERTVAIGPMALLRACAKITLDYEMPLAVSLAAVIGHEDEMRRAQSPDSASEPFDWHDASDLDGHDIDYDKLAERLGLHALK